MPFQLKDVLDAVGPTASLVFAAWIFLSYLQARYTAAAERYRELADNYRNGAEGNRARSVSRQILLYKRRCDLMCIATDIGVVSAMLLISALVLAAFEVVLPLHHAIAYVGTTCAIVGLLLVIAAAVCVLFENRLMQQAMQDELSDVPGIGAAASGDASEGTQANTMEKGRA